MLFLAFTDEDGDIIITLGGKTKEHGASKSTKRHSESLCNKFGNQLGSVKIKSLGNNKFIFTFSSELEHRRV